MDLEYLPLLQVQLDLYRMPRGMERFQAYLKTLIDPDSGDMQLPLAAMNPMGKDHLPPFLEGLLAMGADRAGADAMARASAALSGEPGRFRVTLVVSDDLMGGWTNRYTGELTYRFQQKPYYRRGWLAALAWTSETYTPGRVGQEVAACIYRAAYVGRRGLARNLREMLIQEGEVLARSGAPTPLLSEEELEYTRGILAPLLGAGDTPTVLAALFGDEAARQLGHPPLGLSPWAALALARRDAGASA